MMLHVDIVGIGNKKVTEPKFEMETLDEYILMAKKMISSMATGLRYGLAEEMLNSDDAISNVAHDIMVADWQFNGNGNKFGFRKDRARYSIMSYLSRKARNNKNNVLRLDSVVTPDSTSNFLEFLVDKTGLSTKNIENVEYGKFILEKLERMAKSGIISQKGLKFIKMHYMDDIPVSSIAKQEGITRQSVHETMSRTMKMIRNSLEGELF